MPVVPRREESEGRPPVDGPSVALERRRERTGCRPERPGREPARSGRCATSTNRRCRRSRSCPPARSRRSSDWVASGAPWPSSKPGTASTAAFEPTAAQRAWWAFQPVRSEPPPDVNGSDGAANEIDAFLLDALRSQGHHARASGGPADLDPSRHIRPDRAAADPRSGRGVPVGWFRPRRSRRSSIGCWRRRPTASAGRGTGSTWPATPTTTTPTRRPARPVAS